MAAVRVRQGRALVLGAVVLLLLDGCSGGHHHAGASGRHDARGFEPVSFTAIGPSDYWVLGTVRCRGKRCAAILRTTDAGRSFTRVNAPRLPTARPNAASPTLRFADAQDGFAFVPGVGGPFYATHDGGAHWRRIGLRTVIAFATAGGAVYAVTARCSLPLCTDYRFERSAASADAWRATAMPFTPNSSLLQLEAHGPNVWLLGSGGTERAQKSELARSADGGRTFVTGTGPCEPGLGGELAAVSGRVLWAVCPTGTLAGAWRSTDGGATFAHVPAPQLVNSALIAPASAATAILARNGAPFRLLQTTDAGATWTRASTPGGASFVSWAGFTTERVGAALVQTHWDPAAGVEAQALWRTTDGGASWTNVPLA